MILISTNKNVLLQVLNWLKWEVLNDTLLPELRITAFQSLWQCSEEEAEAVATLITQRDSDSQGINDKAMQSNINL